MRLLAAMLDASALVPHVLALALVFHVLVLAQEEVSVKNEFSAESIATT